MQEMRMGCAREGIQQSAVPGRGEDKDGDSEV